MANSSSQISKIVILSDSYLNCHRIKGIVKNNQIDISPHTTSNNQKKIKVTNFASGGQTFNRLKADQEVLQNWAQSRPSVTIIHIGACDLINKKTDLDTGDKKLGKKWVELIIEFVEALNKLAEEYQGDTFSIWAESHKFVLVQLPDWREFESHRADSLNFEQYRKIRKNINKHLKDYMSRFWHHHKVLVIQPRTADEDIQGVHLSPGSQTIYNKDIFNAVSRLLCSYCSPKGAFSNKTLQEERMCIDRKCKKAI